MFDFLPYEDHKSPDITENIHQSLKFELKDRIAVLTIAYHSLGTQQEFIKMPTEAVQSYNMAYLIAKKYMGPTDSITKNMKEVYQRVQKELLDKMNK